MLSFVRISDLPSLKQYLIPYQLHPTLKLHKVPKNCSNNNCQLREFVTNVLSSKHGFRRGHTYYEFINEIENILEGTEVLLQDKKNTEKWFRLAPPKEVAAGRLKLNGEGVSRSSFGENYNVFIQSFGSGTRYLPHGSNILYNHGENQVESSNRSKFDD